MNSTIAPVEPREIKERNLLDKTTVTVILSNNLLENPLPLRCIFCAEYLNVAVNHMPTAIIHALYKIEDCDPLLDVRCRLCKLNYRFAK